MTGDDSELSVLVVDDDAAILRTLLLTLKNLGCRAVGESGGEAALAAVEKQAPDLLLTDMRMEGMSGVELTAAALERRPDLICVLMTAFASYENAVEAIKAGAYDYLPKPFSAGELEHLLRRVGDLVRLRRENTRLRQARHGWFEGLTSPAALDLQRLMDKLAQSDVSVLFQGETGTGKTSLARELHRCSARSDKPFVEVVCSAIAEPLFESEVFGHVRGAFTGAVRDRAGKFEAAEDGTLFLDEVGELSPSSQAKLLRFLEDRVIERVGDNKPLRLDVRVLAATNRDLRSLVAEGRFREDLYYRLNIFECRLPPLRERREDILPLAQRFLRQAAGEKAVPVLSGEARDALLVHAWPGNARELRNVMERALLLAEGSAVRRDDLPPALQGVGGAASGGATADETRILTLAEVEEAQIRKVLGLGVSMDKAAALLGITTVTLWRKRKELGLD